jgi:DNA-binding beta-propeller fold protein YncE
MRSRALFLALAAAALAPTAVRAQFETPPVYVTEFCTAGSTGGHCRTPCRNLATDLDGNVYIATQDGDGSPLPRLWDRVVKFDGDGHFIREWGSYGTGPGQFDFPSGITVQGNEYVYVVDAGNHRVQKFTTDGDYVLEWPTSDDPFTDAPFSIAVDRHGFLFVTQHTGSLRVQKFDGQGELVTRFGPEGLGRGEMTTPMHIAVDSQDHVYITDPGGYSTGDRVLKYSTSGQFEAMWGGVEGSALGAFKTPLGIAVDANDRVYVVDHHNARVQKFSSDGQVLGYFGSKGNLPGQFSNPHGLAADRDGNLFLIEYVGAANLTRGYIHKFSYRTATEAVGWGAAKQLFR